MVEDAFDDVRHEHRLGRIILLDLGAVGPLVVGAVDARVDQVGQLAVGGHEVFAGRAAHRIGLLPDLVGGAVGCRLRALQARRQREFGGIHHHAGRHLRGRHVDGAGVVQREQDGAKHQRRGQRAGQDRVLLQARRGADQEARLEVLRSGAGVTGGDADDGADRQGRDVVLPAGPAHEEEDQAGKQQRGHGHARNRVR